MNSQDTIVALATPQGVGAIGVIRLSGSKAISITQSVWRGKDLTLQSSHTIHYGHIVDGEKELDEVMVSLFRAPRSFTTEDVVEISCHGSQYILDQILKLLVRNGAQMAQPGEFTMRAFLNGRIDLSQAEAVADTIAVESEAAHRVAMQQMRGGISSKLRGLRTSLIEFAALIELELDFAEEDVEFADRNKFKALLMHLKSELALLISSFKYGNAVKNGIPVAIIGKPNAGKSTLLNGLLNEERAIVSEIAGTTRDTIEETLTIDGHLFRLIDTAGIRDTTDTIERLGVERSREKISQAEIILYLYDYTTTSPELAFTDMNELRLPKDKTIVLANKADLEDRDGGGWSEKSFFANFGYEYFSFLIALREESISHVKKLLISMVKGDAARYQSSVVITNQRHYEELKEAFMAIEAVLEKIEQGISSDFISQDIKSAIRHLGQITGDIEIDRDILGTIFSKFCIGK